MTLLFVKNTVESPFLFRDRNHPVIILPEKKNPAVFLQISAAFRFFFGKLLEISGNFQDFSGKMPADIRRVHSVFFPWKKTKKY